MMFTGGYQQFPPVLFPALLLVAVLVELFVIGLAAYFLWSSKFQYEKRAEVTTQNLTLALGGHIADAVDGIDVTVLTVVDEVERQLAAGGIDESGLNAFITRQQAHSPFLDGLRVVNAQGENAYGIGITPGPRSSVADRSYFLRLRSDPAAGLVISEPVVGRVSKKWSIILARRVNRQDGSFAGLVYGTITLEHFLANFSVLDIGKHGAVTLRNAELAMIARYPEPEGFSKVVGKNNASSQLQYAVQSRQDSGSFCTDQNIESITRMVSFRKVSNRPLYVIIGLAREEYLAAWRREVLWVGLLVLLFFLGTVMSAWWVYRGWVRRTGALDDLACKEEALRESEVNFRAFFQSVGDMIFVATPTGRLLCTNKAVSQTLGYSDKELLELGVLDLHPADKRAEAGEILAAMVQGMRDYCPLPLLRKDGGVVPVETRVWSGRWNGVDCIFGTSKNLTDEQEAQQRFERLFRNNPALMALSTLPERKFFDVNDAFLTVLGYSRSEIIGKTVGELKLFEDSGRQDQLADQLLKYGRIAGVEMQLSRKDGAILTGLFSGEIIISQGRQYFLTVMIDITERKRSDALRQEALDRLQKIASQVPGVVYQYLQRPDGSVCMPFASEAIREMFQVSPEEIREDASKVFAAIHPDDRAGSEDSSRKSAQGLVLWTHCR